ncbi:hypothetical protein IJI31_01945 [bacterium]|nr:hypothetical protein [bacterium]
MKKTREEVVSEMQKVAEQMRIDDIEENPDCEYEFFTCDACGEYKSLAGSIQYGNYRLCNDCVMLAETCFELKEIETIEDFLNGMEDHKLEVECEYIKQNSNSQNN